MRNQVIARTPPVRNKHIPIPALDRAAAVFHISVARRPYEGSSNPHRTTVALNGNSIIMKIVNTSIGPKGMGRLAVNMASEHKTKPAIEKACGEKFCVAPTNRPPKRKRQKATRISHMDRVVPVPGKRGAAAGITRVCQRPLVFLCDLGPWLRRRSSAGMG